MRNAGTNNAACAGIVVQGNATVCRLVNDSAVTVATVLEGASLRRRRVGFILQPNVTRSFWVDVTIPKTAGPGNYTGNVSVTCTGVGANVTAGMRTTTNTASAAMNATDTTAASSSSGSDPTALSSGAPLITVGISVEVWPIAAECIELQTSKYGKAWGFDHEVVGRLQPNKTSVAIAEAEVAEFMCHRHTVGHQSLMTATTSHSTGL